MLSFRSLALCLAVVVLSACGGGGGGGGGDEGFSVSFDRSSVSMGFAAGSPAVPAVVQATSRGTAPGPIFVGATTPSGLPDPNILQVVVQVQGSSSATVSIEPNAALPVGSYSGTLLLLACHDDLCNQHYSGSPFTLRYSITVTPGITLTPDTTAMAAVEGASVSQSVAVGLPAGLSAYTATAVDGPIVVDQIGAAGFRVTASSAVPGVFAAHIEVRAGTIVRTLELQFTARPLTLALDKTSLVFNLVSGATASAEIAVTELPRGASAFSAGNDGTPWLTVTQAGGRVTASVAAMPSGNFVGSLSVVSNGATVTVPVTYVVAPPAGGDVVLSASLNQIGFAAPQGMSAPSQLLGLVRPSWNPEVAVGVSYAGADNWLQSSPQPDGSLQFSASAVGLAAGTHTATVTLTGAYPSPVLQIPVSFVVGQGLVRPLPQFIVVTGTTPATVNGGSPVVADGPSTLTWRATDCGTWLRLTRATGVLGTSLEYEVDVTQLRALALAGNRDGLSCQIDIVVDGPPLPAGGVPIAQTSFVVIAMFDPPLAGAAPSPSATAAAADWRRVKQLPR